MEPAALVEPLVERQVPEMAKHPAERLIPLAKVEDAVVDATFKTLMVRPPVKVEVALLPTLRLPVMVVEPVFPTAKRVVVAEAVEEPMAKRMVAVSPLLAWMESLAKGEEVPMPIVPEVGSLNAEVVAGSEPKRREPILSWLFPVALGKKMLEPMPILLNPLVRLLRCVPKESPMKIFE